MTPASPTVPLWAEAYVPDFRALEQILGRAQHFFLQPVEAPSQDLARILANWLRATGWTIRLIELGEPESWTKLAEFLQEPSADQNETNRAVIVSAPHDLDVEVLHMSMARVNMQRDTIARSLDCPLLWCGTRSFQQLTWEHAPDFWSIASVPYRIPLRDLADAQLHSPTSVAWWTGAVGDDPAALETAFINSVAAGSNSGESASVGLRLAECQLVRGDLGAATQILETVRPLLPADLEPRWQALHGAVAAETTASTSATIDQLHGQISAARARGSKRAEASSRAVLARHLRALPDESRRHEARDHLYQARALFAGLGDKRAVALVDNTLIELGPPPAEVIEEMIENAEEQQESDEPVVRYAAATALVQLYQWQHRMLEADHVLDRMLTEHIDTEHGFWFHFDALESKAKLAQNRDEWQQAYDINTEIIQRSERSHLASLGLSARYRRALACVELDKPLQGCTDSLAAARIAQTNGQHVQASVSAQFAAEITLYFDLPGIAAAVLLWAACALLHHLSSAAGKVPQFQTSGLRDAGETELAERLDDLNSWIADVRPTLPEPEMQQRLAEFRQEFQQRLDIRAAELRSQGIDMMDPLTWGISEDPPANL